MPVILFRTADPYSCCSANITRRVQELHDRAKLKGSCAWCLHFHLTSPGLPWFCLIRSSHQRHRAKSRISIWWFAVSHKEGPTREWKSGQSFARISHQTDRNSKSVSRLYKFRCIVFEIPVWKWRAHPVISKLQLRLLRFLFQVPVAVAIQTIHFEITLPYNQMSAIYEVAS